MQGAVARLHFKLPELELVAHCFYVGDRRQVLAISLVLIKALGLEALAPAMRALDIFHGAAFLGYRIERQPQRAYLAPETGQNGWSWCQIVGALVPGSFTSIWSKNKFTLAERMTVAAISAAGDRCKNVLNRG